MQESMQNIERIKKHLERAYASVNRLKVNGDAVDVVYEVREELRAAFRVAEKMGTAAKEESPRHASGAALPPLTRGALEQDGNEQEVQDAAAENEV